MKYQIIILFVVFSNKGFTHDNFKETLKPIIDCRQPFTDAKQTLDFFEKNIEKIDEKSLDLLQQKIIQQLTKNSETFLNQCVELNVDFKEICYENLEKLNTALQDLLPIECKEDGEFQSMIQIFQIKKTKKQIILIDKSGLDCSSSKMYDARALVGFSFDKTTQQWRGQIILPKMVIDLDEKKGLKITHLKNVPDAKQRDYFSIEFSFSGASASQNHLIIFRFEENKFEIVFQKALSNWCMDSNNWIINAEKGEIIAPAAKNSFKCEKLRPERRYYFNDDKVSNSEIIME